MRGRCSEESGQVVPLLALLVLVAGGASLFVSHVAAASLERGRARTAADAAALAGAAAGEPAARDAAAANGGRLVSFDAAGPEARVRVEVERAVASARARRSGSADGQGGQAGGAVGGLAPALRAALARAEQLLGERVPVTSGFRSSDDQARLWAGRFSNKYPVAPPGRSAHERGLAIDVPAGFADRLASIGPRVGLCRPYPTTDPIHFELCPATAERGVAATRS